MFEIGFVLLSHDEEHRTIQAVPRSTKLSAAFRKEKKQCISGVTFVERRGRVKCDVIYDINSREGSGSLREGSGRIPFFLFKAHVMFGFTNSKQNKTQSIHFLQQETQ